jgi:YVTN family beta-propeller protein
MDAKCSSFLSALVFYGVSSLAKRAVFLGGAVAAILVVSLVVGIFVLPRGQTSTTTATPSALTSSDTSTATLADPLPSFGAQTSTVTVGASPYGIAYDAVSGDVFVAVSGTDNVVILDDQSVVVGNVTLGGAADFLAYDPSNFLLYASLVGSNSIAVINTTLDSVVSSVTVGAGPGWVAYDPASATVYSVNREANTVSVISNASLVKTIPLDGLPFALAYDPSDGDMYVTNNAGTVFVINATSNSLTGNIQVGGASSDLLGIAYNPSDQSMYVTSYSDDKAYVVDGSQVTGSVGGFDAPIGISFKAATSEMFVVNSGNDTVTASWKGDSSTILIGPDPREVVFDSSVGAIVVTDYGGSTLSIVGA